MSRSGNNRSLGLLISLHYAKVPKWQDAVLVFIGIPAILAPFILGLWLSKDSTSQIDAIYMGVPWMIISAIAFFCVAILTIYWFSLRRHFSAIHENGLRLRTGVIRTRSLLWSEISGISNVIFQEQFLHLPVNTKYLAVLYPLKGNPIRIRNKFQDMPGYIYQIKAILYPKYWTGLVDDYKSGKRIAFGPLSIHNEDIQINNQSPMPWHSVAQINISSGYFHIKTNNKGSMRIPVIKIPNIEMMIRIIQQEVGI